VLYFLLFFVVFLIPVSIRFWADTEKDAIIIRAEIMLPFKSGIKFLKKSITAKKVISSLFSRKKAKQNKAPIFNIVLKHSRIKKLDVQALIGTGDASTKAFPVIKAFGLIAPVAANISKGNFNLNITPVFEKAIFNFSGECIFRLNLARIIIIFTKIKFSGGKKKWKSIRLKT